MGNFTSGTATIHTCPPHRVRTVMEILERYGFVDWDELPDRLTLALGEAFTAEGTFSHGAATELAAHLSEAAPEIAFTVDEEPVGEPGTTCTYVPGLGLFAADCDNDGEALFGQSDILQWLTEPADVLEAKLGVPWRTAIAAMPDGAVEEAESAVVHWAPHHCALTVYRAGTNALHLTVLRDGDQSTPDFAAADKSLEKAGFQRSRDWAPLNESVQLWRTDVYKASPST